MNRRTVSSSPRLDTFTLLLNQESLSWTSLLRIDHEDATVIVRFLRRLLLRIGYSLPRKLQRPFYSSLYDGELPRDSGQIKLSISNEPETFVHFEFVGGSLDGKVYEGPLANIFYWGSEHGKVGHQFKVASDADVDAMMAGEPTGPILKHAYEIIEN